MAHQHSDASDTYAAGRGFTQDPPERGPEFCPETSNSRHAGAWYDGEDCDACGSPGPREDEPAISHRTLAGEHTTVVQAAISGRDTYMFGQDGHVTTSS